MKVHKNLQKIRNNRQLSQEEVAKKLLMSKQAFQKIESGKTKLDAERIQKLAEIYEIPHDEFYSMLHNPLTITIKKNESVILQNENCVQNINTTLIIAQYENLIKNQTQLIENQQLQIKNLSEEIEKLRQEQISPK